MNTIRAVQLLSLLALAVVREAAAQAPARPTNLTVTASSSTQLNLSWTDASTNETGFKIERSPDDVTTNYVQVALTASNLNTFSSTGLNPGVKYYFRVRAFNGSGDSAYSETNSAVTLTPLAEWLLANFTPAGLTNAAVSGLLADPDGDGLSNLEEHARGTQPLTADATNAPPPAIAPAGTNAFLTLTHFRKLTAIDARFTPEASASPGAWSAGSNFVEGPLFMSQTTSIVMETFRDKTPVSDAGARFLRLRVEHHGVPDTWLTGSNMFFALDEVACGIISNLLYVVGGNGTNAALRSNTVAYNFVTATWTNGATLAKRPFPGNHHAAEVFDGRLYLLGGLGSNSEGRVQIYDPGSNVWTQGTAMPWNAGSCASALVSNFIYVAGGSVGGTATNRLARYDPASDTWTNLAPMPQGRHHTASATDGTRLYVFGGRINSLAGFDDTQIYDPASGTWTNSAAPGSIIAPLPLARSGMGKAAFLNGGFYVLGGEATAGSPGTTPRNVYNRVDVYDPAANTWRQARPMPTARHGICPAVFNGRIYVAAGGIAAGGGATGQSALLEIYIP